MDTSNMDIVYTVKNGNNNEELRYSLRSIKNLPHRDVWFYGGRPEWVKNVKHAPLLQDRITKWANVGWMLKEVCMNSAISDNFIWFNDDFFIMQPIERLNYYHDRTLEKRIEDFRFVRRATGYRTILKDTKRYLEDNDYTTFNYELHIPIIFNKKRLLDVIMADTHGNARRTRYGNIYSVPSTQMSDVKIYDMYTTPPADAVFVSTDDESFRKGRVGQYLRAKFDRPSEFEHV